MNKFILFVVLILLFYLVFAVCFNIKLKENLFKPEKLKHSIKNSYFDNNKLFIKKFGKTTSEYITCFHLNNFENSNTLLYFHGRTGNINKYIPIIEWCNTIGLNLLVIDYRGYGLSSSYACLKNYYEDVDCAYKYLKNSGVKKSQIIIWGESLGSIAAINLACKHKCKKLILYGAMSCISDVSLGNYNNSFLYDIIGKMINNINNKERIKKVTCPTMIIHSKKDEIIPFKCAKILYQNVSCNNSERKLITIYGNHSEPIISQDNFYKILGFIEVNPKLNHICIKKMKKFLSLI